MDQLHLATLEKKTQALSTVFYRTAQVVTVFFMVVLFYKERLPMTGF
jgi:hypothetical protein